MTSRILLSALFLAFAVASAVAGPSAPDSAAVAAFADSIFDYWIARAPAPVPGGVVAVADDAGPIFARGYGMADRENGEPFDPATTSVGLASVTKLFTATAIAQLAADGRVDIDAPAERYLAGLRLSSSFAVEITLRHLLTHAAGFDESMIGLKSRKAEDIPPLADFLAGSVPPVVREPGTTFSYSNVGISLASLAVETVTGEPFEEAVRRMIFAPLGMTDTAFETQPPTRTRLMRRYEYGDGQPPGFSPVERDYVNLRGAAGLRSTALDMSRFIGACLRGVAGEHDRNPAAETPVVSPGRGIALAMREQFAPCPSLPRSMGLGWHLERRDGSTVAWHAGGNRGAGCFLFVAPARNVGFFIAWNHTAGGGLQSAFLDGFLERFVGPVDAPEPLAGAGDGPTAEPSGSGSPAAARPDLSGRWRYLPHSRTTIEKFTRFPDGGLSIEARRGDTLRVNGRPFVPAAGDAWVYPPSGESICFYGGEAGRPLYMSWNGLHTFRRLPPLEEPAVTMSVLILCVLALVSLLAIPIVSGILSLAGRRSGRPRAGAGCAAAAMLLIFLPLVRAGAGSASMVYDPPVWLALLLVLPFLAIIPSAVFALRVVDEWRRGAGALAGRLHRTIVLTAILVLYWMMHAQNLLGWHW